MRVGVQDMPVVDVDTHVIEHPDIWTTRLPRKWEEHAPRIEFDTETNKLMWFIDGKRVFPALSAAHAGWHEVTPSHPPSWEDADKATYDVESRVALMDEYGISVQVLYPNIAMFASGTLQENAEAELQNELIRAYNDWQLDWTSYAPGRFAPMASLPFWDLEATATEMTRCAERGFRGVVFSQDPTAFGLPALVNPYWDAVWAQAQDHDLVVNFHIGSAYDAGKRDNMIRRHTNTLQSDQHIDSATSGATSFLANAKTIGDLILSGICHRFPRLNFVSVESGAGYVPFVLETLDWQWINNGLPRRKPDFLLPSEYFRRQIYATFWFERGTLRGAIEELGSGNLMYETDFPHPTSMSPGPGSPGAVPPPQYVSEVLGALNEDDRRNILYRNAARIYHLDLE